MTRLIFALIGLALVVGSYQFDAAGLATHPAQTFMLVCSLMIGGCMILASIAAIVLRISPSEFVMEVVNERPMASITTLIYFLVIVAWGSAWDHSVISAATAETGQMILVSIGIISMIAYLVHDRSAHKRRQVTPTA